MECMNRKKLAWLSLIVFFLVLLMNYLSAADIIPGISPQKEVSKIYNTPITPAGFAFSIWGVIYLLLFAAIVYMIRASTKEDAPSVLIDKIMPPLFVLFAANMLWNVAFGLKWIGISLILIFVYWLSLVSIGRVLVQAKTKINPVLPLAFGVHSGWITIASIVNLYAFLVKKQWNGLMADPELWTIIGIAAAVLLVAILQLLLKNAVLPLGTAWALFGIYMKEGVVYSKYGFIPALLLAGIGLLILLAVLRFAKNRNCLLPR